MTLLEVQQRIISTVTQDAYLWTWMEAFLVDRKAQRLATGSISFYRQKLQHFATYCERQAIHYLNQVDTRTLRNYLMYLEETGHNAGGQHAAYRAVKAFLRWYEQEAEPDGWKNPIDRVKAPKVDLAPLSPAGIDDIGKLIAACSGETLTGVRDKAILLALLDTGARAREFLEIDLAHVNIASGTIVIAKGKTRKPRTVYLGTKCRKAIRAYLRHRRDDHPALWITVAGQRMTYAALRAVVATHARQAGIRPPALHSFRRAFAINFLRNNPGDIYRLRDLMGHSGLSVLVRYLKFLPEDLAEAHRRAGPVDNSKL